jgi:hypothetical protein
MTYQEFQKQIVQTLRYHASQEQTNASFGPIRVDYQDDTAISLTSVVFLPVELACLLSQALIAPMKAIEPNHYYYPPESLHLTIKNVRTIHNPPLFTEADIQKVDRLFAEVVPRHPTVSYALAEVVPFTTSVVLIGYCDERFKQLILDLDEGLKQIGVPDNKQYASDTVFFGNITLCRYTRQPSERFLNAVASMAEHFQTEFIAETIHLIATNAVCAPQSRRIVSSYKLQNSS